MHDEALDEYDTLADSAGPAYGGPLLARWLQDVRYASLGFSLWESQAPRYTGTRSCTTIGSNEPRFPSIPPAKMGDHPPAAGPGASVRPPPPTLRNGFGPRPASPGSGTHAHSRQYQLDRWSR